MLTGILLDQAVAQLQAGRLEDAEKLLAQVLKAEPNNPAALFYTGNLLQLTLRHAEAVPLYDRLLALEPNQPQVWNDRGKALQAAGGLADAAQSFHQALACDPGFAPALLNQGLLYLLQGDFDAGLLLYEARKALGQEARIYPQPLWTGAEDINGKTLFCYVEQGLGDAIQFYRYVVFAIERGARVVLAAPDALLPLLSRAVPTVTFIGLSQTPSNFDLHIPLASIPLAVGMTLETIPAPTRYLSADPQRTAHWKARLGDHGFRIAVAWQGKEAMLGEEGKSFPPDSLEPLRQIPGVRLIAVQKGSTPQPWMENHAFDDDGAFLDSAAIMQNCNLVISADSSPAHLAGALGVPCWVALKPVPDWRWLMQRSDTPWYPATRLFRQPRAGDWSAVFEAMANDLISRSRRS
jgi:tetratricopeptide (TPR) repeat protein